ncbi:MAG: 3-hydroxyacyl-[acyl-carrier-protein] dehydratase FabZ [Proteobacteria bacterium]|nr:3-hydroxyacyl-[acyl-carrier-protein] dehydratase FabZ [Pseudomonadota bacterium]
MNKSLRAQTDYGFVFDPPFPWQKEEVAKRLPHRPPMFLIHQVDTVVPWSYCLAWNFISPDDPIFGGHFPHQPIYPGVMILESLGQSAAVLFQASSDAPLGECLLTGVKDARFFHPVLPGDALRCEVNIERERPPFFWNRGRAFVKHKCVATALLIAYCRNADELVSH